MIVRKLRLKNGWSQEQLAEMSGLNVRTIQRVERGLNVETETLKSIAAVFEVDFTELKQEPTMNTDTETKSQSSQLTMDEEAAIAHVQDIKAFYKHLVKYLVAMPVMTAVNLIFHPDYLWVLGVGIGWGMGVLIHGLNVFEVVNLFFPADWEKRQIEKRLGRKL